MRRALLVLMVLLVASSVSAQPGAVAVRQATRTWTEEQVLANVTGNNVAKSINWGRVVRYGGNILMAAGLVYTALEWFYDQAQQSTGTGLDDWGDGIAGQIAFNCLIYAPQYSEGLLTCQTGGGNTGTLLANGSLGRIVDHPPLPQDWFDAWSAAAPNWSGLPGEFTTPGVWVGPGAEGHSCQGVTGRQSRRCYLAVGRPDLEALLRGDPGALGAIRNQVLPDYLSSVENQSNWPYTYGEPYGSGQGVQLQPAPNQNQWYDNPYANPQLDTDGDGWPDWKEVLAGTDPNDENSFPTVDPAPDTEPGQDPLPDTDGDGIPDIYDPCPYDAMNRCADGEVAQDPIEIPDDYAREITLQGIAQDAAGTRTATERTADATEQIRDLLEGQEELTGEATMPELEAAWSGVVTRLEASLASIRTAAEGKVGFNAGGIIPQLTASGGGSCEEITITLLGITRPLGWCGSSFYNLVTTWGRNGIALIMLIGFAFASARTMGAL